jgi:hypothetical protein
MTDSGTNSPSSVKTGEILNEKMQKELNEILGSLRFGSVTLVVQDGKVIQIEKNEKIRFS